MNPPHPIDPRREIALARGVYDGESDFAEPGTAEPSKHHLWFACPGCGKWGAILVGHPKPGTSPSWDIVAGVLDDPTTLTLRPSINCVGCCGWHGFLVAGRFQMNPG